MQLTDSAFNVLLNMTNTTSTSTSPNHHTHQHQTTPLGSTQTMKEATPVIHYSNGDAPYIVSKEELIRLIIAAPKLKHWVWVKGYQSWRSWTDIKSLKNAVMATSNRLGKPVSSQGEKPATAPSKVILKPLQEHQNLISSHHNVGYFSVPATVFTRFEVELSNPEIATPFVGLDHSIPNGGLFIPTDRVLHIGDYVQVKVRVKGKQLMDFEAPIVWLRTTQDNEVFMGGIAVKWPTMTALQSRLIERVTSKDHYEFFVA